MSINVGDALPTGDLQENSPKTRHDPASIFATGRHILFGVPGAFTPGCSKTHLPGYVTDYEAISGKGISSINCIAVNDAFVMGAWGAAHGAEGKVRMLADPAGAYVSSMGLDVNAAVLGGTRSKRFSMLIEDGKVSALNVEPDGFGLSCSLSNILLEQL
ncbi:MAG: 2-Cys peroxiredoxin 5 [Myxococcota bacterium]|jgi:2-Cys peroxiredoxin 5